MTLVVFVGLAAAAVPLARGRLMNLAQVRFRRPWLLFVAMALQAFLILVTGPRNPLRDAAYIASYFFAGAFLWENRRIPGLWLIGAGAALNLLAITMNGGVMPASPHALGCSPRGAHAELPGAWLAG